MLSSCIVCMWQGIQDSGRPMVLTVEGSPPASIITHGGYGNAKRVGHDISPSWGSMISLVDIGAGLWPFAHGSVNAQYGGWWNDLVRQQPMQISIHSVASATHIWVLLQLIR